MFSLTGNRNVKNKNRKMSNIDILVIRSVPNGIGSSRPCQHCLNVMKQLGVNRVFYSIDGNEIICEKVKYMVSDHLSLGGRLVKNSEK
jgi:hypothetical protein